MKRYHQWQWFLDRLFGRRRRRTTRRSSPYRVTIPLPEGDVGATAYVLEDVWLRPRWPWPHRVRAIELQIDTPIGVSDNAVSGVIYSEQTPPRAVQRLINDIRSERRRQR